MRRASVQSSISQAGAISFVEAPKRVAIYARVSTTRQAEQDLSLPDQMSQSERFAEAHGWDVAARFVEPGASATDDRRPEFQKMIDAAVSGDRPFTTILVHSMSRFFRDQFQQEFYIRKLRRAGVEVVSISQHFADDPTGQLMRKFIGLFDEHTSAEISKHTLRGMQENARQQFWNGSTPPFGYHAVEAERRGPKIKKRLEILEPEAVIVRDIFDMALGRHGPVVGVKAIVNRLNGKGIAFRGKLFHISNVHRILTSRTYAGEHTFNQRLAKTGNLKPPADWIVTTVPSIIAPEDFEAVQVSLAARSPRQTPPRVVTGPTLLTGVAKCGSCGSGMTIRTGKSGRYRYYTCAGCAQKGRSVCQGRSISMSVLDGLVTEHLIDKLFTPGRLRIILQAYIEKSENSDLQRNQRLGLAKQRQTEISGKISRLLELVAKGLMEADDPDLASQLTGLKAQRSQMTAEVDLLTKSASLGTVLITDEKLIRFADLMRNALQNGDIAFRRTYIRLFVDEIILSDSNISLSGPDAALAQSVAKGALPPSAALVPSFVREWRPVGDSNPCYRRERAASWASRRTGLGQMRRSPRAGAGQAGRVRRGRRR